MTDLIVNISKTIQAPIEKVFDAWLNPEMLSQFILPMKGMPHPQTENDPREGGSFKIIMVVGDEKIPHTGTYLTINRPHKLVFTWESPFSIEGSTVALQFFALDDNQTSLELTHRKFIDEQARSNHEGGWGNILDALDDEVERA
jgi:uncharacterized protein YndB with AHSA1/START domain